MEAKDDKNGLSISLDAFKSDSFVPHAELDALFSDYLSRNNRQRREHSRQSNAPGDVFTGSEIQDLQLASMQLLSKLDHYSNELTKTLESTTSSLESVGNILAYDESRFIPDKKDHESEIDVSRAVTRLDYYIDTLLSSVQNLQVDIYKNRFSQKPADDSIETQSASIDDDAVDNTNVSDNNTHDPLQRLLQLSKIHSRMLEVLNVLLLTRKIVMCSETDVDLTSVVEHIQEQSKLQSTVLFESDKERRDRIEELIKHESTKSIQLTPDIFHASLLKIENGLEEEVVKIGQTKNRDEQLFFCHLIDVLLSLTPMFKSLTKYHPIYLAFSERITELKAQFEDQSEFGQSQSDFTPFDSNSASNMGTDAGFFEHLKGTMGY